MVDTAQRTPRWGNEARDRKALAIWRTLEHCCGPEVADGRWLDVGCGSGGIAAALAGSVRQIHGIDPEAWPSWQDAMSRHANLSLYVGVFDCELPPVPDASFDVVVCNQVYEHVGNPLALLRNIQRVLKPTGVCYFAGPNLLWPIEPHVFWPFVHWMPRAQALRLMKVLGSRRCLDLDAYSVSSWRLNAWFEQAGLKPRNAIPDRMLVSEGEGAMDVLARIIGKLPRCVHQLLVPISPAFVYVLSKKV